MHAAAPLSSSEKLRTQPGGAWGVWDSLTSVRGTPRTIELSYVPGPFLRIHGFSLAVFHGMYIAYLPYGGITPLMRSRSNKACRVSLKILI